METKINTPMEVIVLKVGEEKIIDFFELGITTHACNYTLSEKIIVESLIPIKHILIVNAGLDNVHIIGKIRGTTQLRLEYEDCSKDPLFRKKYIQAVEVQILE